MTKNCNRLRGERPKAFWGALVGGAMNLIGSAISSKSQARAIRRQIEAQKEAARTQLELANNSNLASTLNSYAAATRSYNDEDDYNLKYRLGGNKRLGSNRIYITDGGNATKIGNDTYLLRGGSHEQTNETGQTGIGINVGGNEIEAEGGEVAQKKNGALRIFSAQPILGGISPAQAVMSGASKDKVFNAQQRFKRRNHLSDGGDRAKWGIGWIDSLFGNDTPKKKTVHFYKSQATGKVFKTKQEAIAENNKYKTNLGYRRNINREREVEAAIRKQGNERIPYIKEKEIKLTNAGKLTGTRLSTNQLDSIAKYASKAGLPIKTALGLVGQESAFGNYFGYANNAKDLNTYNTQSKEIRDKYGIPTYKIVNYENLIPERTPTNVDDFAINKRYGKRSVTNFGMPTIINGDELDKLKVQHEAYPALQRKRSKFWRDINTPTLQLAFEHYKTSPQTYNAGNSNQQNLVNSKANDVWGSPEIQKWYRKSPYVKHRLGGRCKLRNGGLTSKDRGSSKHPYPSVSSKDFAGGGRSYPIPTKADAVDALRLAGLHGRSDVRSKVYSKYPSLRPKAAFGDWVKTNRDDNPLADLLYESGLFDRESWNTMLRDIHDFTGMGGNPYDTDDNVDAVMAPAFGSSSTRVLSQLAKSPEASYTLKQVLGLPTKEMVRKRIAGDIAKRIGVARAARQSSNFRNYNIARMQAANAEASFSPFANQVRYAEGKPVLVNTNGYYTTAGNTISRNAKNMTSGANPFLYAPRTSDEVLEGLSRVISSAKQGAKSAGQKVGNKFKGTPGQKLSDAYYDLTPMQRAKLKGLTLAATLSIPAGYFVESQNGRNKKVAPTPKDAHGKPISQYIARPQEPIQQPSRQISANVVRKAPVQQPSRPQAKKVAPAQIKKVVSTQKPVVVPKQVKKTVPQYKGNTTKGNYQLHDGETRTINGIKYTRRGNTIINHKTNVGYIYDKNGNYTGQADYSKVGNFNQAFDAARAAGRSQFIYRAGKYNNYSTIKETNAKKERLNRIVGARRVAKALGGYSRPVEGMRPKAGTGIYVPFNKRYTSIYDAPDYNSDYNGGNVLGNGEVTITAKRIKPTFMKPNNDAMNIINHPASETPYIPQHHNHSRTIFSGGDYLGLGIDALSALGTGLITSNAYKNLDFNYNLPNFVEESPVALNTTYHNEAQKSNVERNRLNSRNSILRNTMSGSTAVGRMQGVDTNALYQLNQLADTKENKETELMNQNLLNEQQVRARNAAARNQYYNTVASIKNAALEAKNNASLARSQAFSTSLSGLSQAWNNFWTAGRTAYEDDQARRAMIASSKDATPTKLIEMGYDLSPQIIAALYSTSTDQNTKDFYLSMLDEKQRRKYGIS